MRQEAAQPLTSDQRVCEQEDTTTTGVLDSQLFYSTVRLKKHRTYTQLYF